MSIEQKIAALLAESRGLEEEQLEEGAAVDAAANATTQKANRVTQGASAAEATNLKGAPSTEEPNNAKNDVEDESAAENATSKKPNKATAAAAPAEGSMLNSVKEDIDALMNGEDLSEDFRTKATTIFEAAVMTRVNQELASLQEEFDARLNEQVEEITEGLVDKVDGYLNYVVEQWIEQNEIALESGMKSEIMEEFIGKIKNAFEESYIEIPEEKFDVLGAMQEQVEQLEAKLDETLAHNVELSKVVNEQARVTAIAEATAGLTDTDAEKFKGLAEELAFDTAETFSKKLQTIRENYFVNKTSTAAIVESIVTDSPVLTEETTVKAVDPAMSQYLRVLNSKK